MLKSQLPCIISLISLFSSERYVTLSKCDDRYCEYASARPPELGKPKGRRRRAQKRSKRRRKARNEQKLEK